jgi:hypothetical protein
MSDAGTLEQWRQRWAMMQRFEVQASNNQWEGKI